MKKILLLAVLYISLLPSLIAQNIGDTITIESFNYSQTYGVNQWSSGIRDTIIDFSVLPNQPIEKVLMLYNMRCKDNKVSNSSNRDQGCGEWDISCNTYLYDSTRIDSILYTHPNYVIPNFSGQTFNYTTQPIYDINQYQENIVTINSTTTESSFSILNGNSTMNTVFDGTNKSGKSQFLYTAIELTNSGFTAGDINGFNIEAINSGNIRFLRVKLKAITETELSPNSPILDNLTQVFFDDNYTFQNGNNRIQFETPFNWNGTDNLIVEYSFTNSTPTTSVQLKGSPSSNKGIYCNNSYHVNLANNSDIDVPTTALTSIQNEITVSFWVFGQADLLPSKTFTFFASDDEEKKSFNVHLPWDNSNVYFDCGNEGSSYDRINKTATANEFENQWNHWAFTKNVDTGIMKIFLNGSEWHSGTGKTKPISINEAKIFGYKGKIDEFRIWNKALSETEINDWKNIRIENTHPYYSNLMAYFSMDEGNDTLINDISNNSVVASSNNPNFWKYKRGADLVRFFKADNNRPNLTVLRGNYDLSISQVTVIDSILREPTAVQAFDIISNSGTLLDDEVFLVSTIYLWESTNQNIYEGSTTNILSTNPVDSEGSYTISNLEYQRRFPAKIEIMSFVTPYGLGLDLGPKGKTWTFDMTDFLPIFKGKKRMTMERGGQWMEDMDIKFLFILGTPPRNVIGFNQIWRPESRSYSSLESDRYFAPRTTTLDPNGKHFKIRSSISGHGQQGEFISRQHYININGGNNEFNWQVWKECAENPIYPQGGTWIYDRAGWCPGSPTDVQHFDITTLVNNSQDVTIDYGVLNASGTSNYIINNQLITYGDINHNIDASIVEIREPSNRVEFSRFNSICHTPKIMIKNTGKTTLNSLKIKYWINNSTTPLTYEWSGSLEFDETEIVSLPSPLNLWTPVNTNGNVFHAKVESPNGETDEYEYNDSYHSKFEIPDVLPEDIVIYFKTNNAAGESSYKIIDSNGNVMMSRNGMSNNTTYKDTINLAYGCYTFITEDTGDDGIDFWANNDGLGICRIYKAEGGIVKTFDGDFGDNINFEFTVGSPLKYEDIVMDNNITVYPNPTQSTFTLQGKEIHNASIKLYDNLNRKIDLTVYKSIDKIKFDASLLSKGIYLIQIELENKIITKKLIVN